MGNFAVISGICVCVSIFPQNCAHQGIIKIRIEWVVSFTVDIVSLNIKLCRKERKELFALRSDTNTWLWKIARLSFCFFRNRGKQNLPFKDDKSSSRKKNENSTLFPYQWGNNIEYAIFFFLLLVCFLFFRRTFDLAISS